MKLAEWRRQAIVRALVMDDLTTAEIAAECGVSADTVRRVRRELDRPHGDNPNGRRG